MSRKVLGLIAALILVAIIIPVAIAQTRRPQSPAFEQAQRAVLEGRYDEVERLVSGLDPMDPAVAALAAQAHSARGRYQQAEAGLRPSAQRAPSSDAALELGLLLQMQGRAEAAGILTRVASIAETATNPGDLARAARALWALGRVDEANAAYRDAASTAPKDAAINTAWGDLFLEKYKKGEAMKSYQPVLRDNPRYVPALLGAARALADEDPPEAVKMVKQALEINPSSVPAHLFLAGEAADAGHRDEARKSLQRALEVNPSSLEAHSLMAALAFIEDKPAEYEEEIAKALAINPRYGEAYRVVGEFASHNFRYDEATELGRKAIALDPGNPRIAGDLGIHLLRSGDEGAARAQLEASFKADPYSQVTFNLLMMMDNLDKFVTLRDGNLVVRMDKFEAGVIGDQAIALSHQALDTLSKRYGFTPDGPFLIEIFPKHDDFAVRIAGLPGMVGALGVCFGKVVALDSPRANPGTFQWEATLWHELAHVITLQMSKHRIPRWLTEGISTYEERLQRPEWGRGQDIMFVDMMNRDQVIKLKDLNAAFTNPRLISIAYFEAGLLSGHIIDTYGMEGMQRLLRAYAQGLDTDAAIKSALNTTLDAMQSGFDQTLEKLYGKLKVALKRPAEGLDFSKMPPDAIKKYAEQNETSFGAQMMLAGVLRKENDLDGALKAFERAAELVPMATGDDSPHEQIAEIALQKKDADRAITALQAAVAVDFDNAGLARQLATMIREKNPSDWARLRPVYQRIVAIDPFDADAQSGLGRILMAANQPEAASRHFKAVVGLNPIDKAAAHTDLAESYLKSGKRPEARRQTLAALEVAPSYERAQNLLLELAGSRP